MILADAALVFVERQVKHPVQGVLDAPMIAHRARQSLGIRREAAEIVTYLAGGLAIASAVTDRLAQAASASPGVFNPTQLFGDRQVIIVSLVAPSMPFLVGPGMLAAAVTARLVMLLEPLL